MKKSSPTRTFKGVMKGQKKTDSIAMGFFVGFVPINELSRSQDWMSWELNGLPGFAIKSEWHQTKVTKQKTHHLIWKESQWYCLCFWNPSQSMKKE